jgi:hypothetical protein
MQLPKNITEKVSLLDYTSFNSIKDKEFTFHYDLPGLKHLRDKAGYEKSLRELYKGRAPYELLQNADDAGAQKVAFILSNDGLAFIHDGKWFTIDNFRSLADGWSDKDPNQCIGHKGLGFRSVLDITPSPYLLKVQKEGFFAIKFSWELNNGHIQETFKRDSSTRRYYEDWTRHGQRACPVMAIPGLAKKQNLNQGGIIYEQTVQENFGKNFTTMFWLPSIDPNIDKKALIDLSPNPIIADKNGEDFLSDFVQNEVRILLPFLANVERVMIYSSKKLVAASYIPEGCKKKEKCSEIKIITARNGIKEEEKFFQMRFSFPIPQEIKNYSDTPKAVKAMQNASLTLSVGINVDGPVCIDDAKFHVYFSTGELTGIGCVIHGDFYVQPDRVHFNPNSRYNDWLLRLAAEKLANEFLTELQRKYNNVVEIFNCLAPTSKNLRGYAETFVELFSEALKKRQQPFIPSNIGLLQSQEIVLPPTIDEDSFWEDHFSESIKNVLPGKKAFLLSEIDSLRTRQFMELSDVDKLVPDQLITFIENADDKNKDSKWLYECFCFMYDDKTINSREHDYFKGRRLVLTRNKTLAPIPTDEDQVLCLTPKSSIDNLPSVGCFEKNILFVNDNLSRLIQNGNDAIQAWIINRFNIVSFEATQLIPQAIRRIAPQIFSGQLKIKNSELQKAWEFVYKITQLARREILASTYWQEIGRFPVLTSQRKTDDVLNPKDLAPAFLSYYPDSFIDQENCLQDIKGLHRIDEEFLQRLIMKSGINKKDWVDYFSRAGVSSGPKNLQYVHVIGKQEEIGLALENAELLISESYTGERQLDENRAAVRVLLNEEIKDDLLSNYEPCTHQAKKRIQSFTIIDGLSKIVDSAKKDYEYNNAHWESRLQYLSRKLSSHRFDSAATDQIYCYGEGRGEGHNIPLKPFYIKQLESYRWLPTTVGPARSIDTFLRLTTRRLIATGQSKEELGDMLLPYVVAENIDDYVSFRQLGLEPLEDVASSTPKALIRALSLLGDRFSSELGKAILEERSRWRLVRGAIQEIYRFLNQQEQDINFPKDIKLATRSERGIVFNVQPLYYAEPGSPLEKAFQGKLSLIDTDRPYPSLFDRIGVIRLLSGETIIEDFKSASDAVPSQLLRNEIANGLAQYLLAAVLAKTDKTKQTDMIARRFTERFEVKSVKNLEVSFSLKNDPEIRQTVSFPKFYLHRQLVPKQGAVEEFHFALFYAGHENLSLFSPTLDADALGEALAPILSPDRVDDLRGLLPRITSRYQQVRGDKEAMEEFLYYQLGISREAQDMGRSIISGEVISPETPKLPLPPPLKIIAKTPDNGKGSLATIDKKIDEQLTQGKNKFIAGLSVVSGGKGQPPGSEHAKNPIITHEQEIRGRRGEEEIKRRLMLPGGWEGFSFKTDKRSDGCGYDFLCKYDNRDVMLEVKTFAEKGRIIFTGGELQVAANRRNDYYLIGVLDDGRPEQEWKAFLLPDPFKELVITGKLVSHYELQIVAADVFEDLKN